jgi:uncharacterized DUF497 family protein
MEVQFEWSEAKAESNFAKHGVSFLEARSAFLDPLARIFDDPQHSEEERREILVGHSFLGRLIFVSFVERESDTIRLISARPATKKERRTYEQETPWPR